MRRLKKWFMDLKITPKIIVYYSIMIIIFMVLSVVVYKQLNYSTVTKKVGQMLMETVKTVDANLNFLIETTSNQEKVLLSSKTLQSALSQNNKGNDPLIQRQVENYLEESMNFNEVISSIYVFDNEGHKYYADNASFKAVSLTKIKEAPWYDELVRLNGSYLLKMNGGGTFDNQDMNYISMIRIINNIDTQKPIGYLMVNISADTINKYLNKDGNTYNTQYILKDENNNDFLHSSLAEEQGFAVIIDDVLDKEDQSEIKKVGNKQYIVSNLRTEFDWKLIAITPFNELSTQDQTYTIIFIITLLVNGVLLMCGIIFTSVLISKPIQKLVNAMKTVERGVFQEVSIKTGNDEIGRLKNVYNMMIREIQLLFDNVVQEQAAKRKMELEALQNQVKPHFLYNTFDAISSLAVSGNHEDVYTIVKALGKFYRSSLNQGNEEITIRQELDIVQQYLTILKYRYGDKFTVTTRFDERTLDCTIPRLVLQPLVENAINHGIRAKDGPGLITVQSLFCGDSIQLIVEDDGAGMNKERLIQIQRGLTDGVGLKATIERLGIYYNARADFQIESRMGYGTKITLTIPVHKG